MKPVVLVIDDEPEVLEVLSSCLEEHFIVIKSSSIDEVEKTLDSVLPDAVVLDLNLQKTQGVQSFHLIKKKLMNTPIIVISGDEQAAHEIRPHADAVIEKGNLDFKAMAVTIRSAMIPEKIKQIFYDPVLACLQECRDVTDEIRKNITDHQERCSVKPAH